VFPPVFPFFNINKNNYVYLAYFHAYLPYNLCIYAYCVRYTVYITDMKLIYRSLNFYIPDILNFIINLLLFTYSLLIFIYEPNPLHG